MTDIGDDPIRLGDRYELGELLGRGGMADVRIARDLRLGRTVAIKQLRTDLSSDDTFQARFRREAQSAAALNHPSIVAVYDTGESTDAQGNHIPYIVMEYVEGQTLRDILKDDRKILPERALSIAADVLSALDYSHRSGIIHRDIKPANVMLTPTGQVKVMDFGIARAIADASSAMTQTAAVIGTAQYLSPEQARGETVDARSDIYSTGCLLYELLTGRPPFVGDSPVSVAYQHVREDPRPPSQLNPDVTASVDNIVALALAKRTDDRYQSASDMRRDLERAIEGQYVEAPTQAATQVAGATAVAPAVAAVDDPEEDEEEGKKSRKKWWILGILALLLLGGLAYAIFQMTRPDPVAQVDVPEVVGEEQSAAVRVLERDDFEVAIEERADSDVDAGLVIEQTPEGGSTAEEGSEVTIVVSTGPDQVDVPNVVNLSFDEAESNLEDAGLRVEREERDSDEERNTVIATNPPANTQVDRGSTVTVIVSRGQVAVPNVVGQDEDQAIKTLEDAGFDVETREDPNATAPEGEVSAQSIPEGQRVAPGTTITITVSTNTDDDDDDGNGGGGGGGGGNGDDAGDGGDDLLP
ncbi:Stk1 family PASTA domain-containing Ser/Thr kinase [Aeromicrobium sp. CTD01-1L150]|uniref:Stk1 family PASTA domain-containing Ser/Thr kinase n=1 Tax=Aeromicrobium sp. CTD01-1L150 TaxID=3341830 RepID=UPI0035BF2B17